MNLDVNWADVAVGVEFLAFAVLVAITWGVVESRRIAVEDRRNNRVFDHEMATVRLPNWDGATYDWPPNLAGYLEDPYAYGQAPAESEVRHAPSDPFPVPPSPFSGPLPGLNTTLDADAFIASMTAQTSAFLAYLAEPVMAR